MIEFLGGVLDYIATLWRVINAALWLDPALLAAAGSAAGTPTSGRAFSLAIGVIMVAGISSLLGQSVTLFINRVQPNRFVFSLLLNGLILVVNWLVWAAVLWLIGRWLFPIKPYYNEMLLLVALSYAPLAFGFLVLIPWMGPFIQRLLTVWSFIIVVGALMAEYQLSFLEALFSAGAGWLVLLAMTATIGRPVVRLRNWLWHRISGSRLDATAQDILLEYASNPRDSSPSGGVK